MVPSLPDFPPRCVEIQHETQHKMSFHTFAAGSASPLLGSAVSGRSLDFSWPVSPPWVWFYGMKSGIGAGDWMNLWSSGF